MDRKYTVVIIDDNSIALKAITTTTDWEKLRCRVVGTATDGITGLDLVKEHAPDILITDIRMPGYDGLQLVRLIRERNDDVIVVIISGYDDFAYARTAMQLGVEDYLLKPVSKEAIENALASVIAKHEKKPSETKGGNPIQEELQAIDSKAETYSLIVRDAIRFLDQNISKNISQQDIATRANVTPWYFSRLFKRETGIGFSRYVTLKKMNQAMILLENPQNKATEVARNLGFQDYSYFFHVYKKVFGHAPTENKYHPQKEKNPYEADGS